jgi:hypothetical protein
VHHILEAWGEQAPVHTHTQKDTPKQAAAAGSPATHLLLVLVLLCCAHPGRRPRAAAVCPLALSWLAFAACMHTCPGAWQLCAAQNNRSPAPPVCVCVITGGVQHTSQSPAACAGRPEQLGAHFPNQQTGWFLPRGVLHTTGQQRQQQQDSSSKQAQVLLTVFFARVRPCSCQRQCWVSVVLASRLTGRSCRSASWMQTGFCCVMSCARYWHRVGNRPAHSITCREAGTQTAFGVFVCACVLGLAGE